MIIANKLKIFLTLLVLIGSSTLSFSQSQEESDLIRAYKDTISQRQKFDFLLNLGKLYKNTNIEKADSIRHLIVKASRVFNDSVRFEALYFDAEVANITGNQGEYFKRILECQPFLNKLPSSNVVYRIYSHLGVYHSHQQEHETARFYFNSCIKSARKSNRKNELSQSYNLLALDFMSSNNKDSSLFFVDKAISSARRLRDKSVLSKAFNTQAKIYNFFGQIELSVAKNLIALQLAEGTKSTPLLSRYTREIGQDQQLILNLNDAQYYFRRSLNYARRINDKRQVALALTNLASVQLGKGEYTKAVGNANEALKYLEKLNDNNGLGQTYNILGQVYKQQENYTKAASNLNQALVYYESTGNREEIAGVYHNVGTVFKEQKKYKNALNYLNRSIEIRENFGAKNQIYFTYRIIADVYKEINNQSKSLEYLELYLDYVDSNTILQSATKIAELSESYRSEQRERLISAQADSIAKQQQERVITSTKLENSQLRLNFQMYIIGAFLIIVLLAGVIFFYRWQQTKIKQEHIEVEMSQTLLRTQMNPHFVFNAMSVIQSYIFDNDTVNSSKFLVNFSRLMRLILENSPKKYIPIETEIEILEKYLGMQKLRFQDRFNFEIVTEDILLEEHANIPPMITQPFIENAIEHGQLHTIKDGFIHVSFKKVNDMLVISIVDNGVGRKGSKNNSKSSEHKSMAIDITSQRIEHLNKKHNTDGSLVVEDYNKELQNGTNVLISLPYTVNRAITN
ncbi:MAG: tetratricopeptide repeat protein [Flavobacteriales bacterium]|nr:tetratricopeptide repeat protein [Flavobacteriales bacterium]